MTRKHAKDLMGNNDFVQPDLGTGVLHRIQEALNFCPSVMRFVAYDNEQKSAIGFLGLKRNTRKLYSLQYIFIDPNYRKMGLATRLINHAISIAKQKGASKVHLDVYVDNFNAISLYKRLGFLEIGQTIFGQNNLPGSKTSRVIKRILIGQGVMTKLFQPKDSDLFTLPATQRNRNKLFEIYQKSINQKIIDFFEIDSNNLIYGSRHIWQPKFFRSIFFDNRSNSFALVFNTPFSYKATVEVYSTSNSFTSMLDDILLILEGRGISFTQISLFNPDSEIVSWFEKNRMMIFQFMLMGKTI